MNGQINDRIKLEEETLRHRRKDSHVGRLGGEARSSPRTEAQIKEVFLVLSSKDPVDHGLELGD